MWAIRYRDIEYPTDLEAEEDRHIDIGALLGQTGGSYDRVAKKDLDGRDDAPFFRGSSKGMNFAFRIIII